MLFQSKILKGSKVIVITGSFQGFTGKVINHFNSTSNDTKGSVKMTISKVMKSLNIINEQTTRIMEHKEHHDSLEQYETELKDGANFYNRIAGSELNEEEIISIIEEFNTYPFTFRLKCESVPMIEL